MALTFSKKYLTNKGRELINKSVAGETPVIWCNCATSSMSWSYLGGDDDERISAAKELTDISVNNKYTSYGFASSAQKTNSNSIAIQCQLTNERDDLVGGAAGAFGIFAKLNSSDKQELVAVAFFDDSNGQSAENIPASGSELFSVSIEFYIEIVQDTVASKIEVSPTYLTSIETFNALSDRVVTTHSADDEHIGDNQTIYGNKTFRDTVTFNLGDYGNAVLFTSGESNKLFAYITGDDDGIRFNTASTVSGGTPYEFWVTAPGANKRPALTITADSNTTTVVQVANKLKTPRIDTGIIASTGDNIQINNTITPLTNGNMDNISLTGQDIGKDNARSLFEHVYSKNYICADIEVTRERLPQIGYLLHGSIKDYCTINSRKIEWLDSGKNSLGQVSYNTENTSIDFVNNNKTILSVTKDNVSINGITEVESIYMNNNVDGENLYNLITSGGMWTSGAIILSGKDSDITISTVGKSILRAPLYNKSTLTLEVYIGSIIGVVVQKEMFTDSDFYGQIIPAGKDITVTDANSKHISVSAHASNNTGSGMRGTVIKVQNGTYRLLTCMQFMPATQTTTASTEAFALLQRVK